MVATLAARLQGPMGRLHANVHLSSIETTSRHRSRETRGLGGGVCVRPCTALHGLLLKGLISGGRSRNPSLHNAPIHRIDPPTLAMSEGEAEITSVQERADGSIFFSFGGGLPPRGTRKALQSRAEHVAGLDAASLTPVNLPHRLPSHFRRHSPIPVSAVRKMGKPLQSPKKETAPAETAVEKRIRETAQQTVKTSLPPRLPSSFLKRSPIPARQGQSPVPLPDTSSKAFPAVVPLESPAEKGTSAVSVKYRPDPVRDSPLSPALQEIVGTGLEFLEVEREEVHNSTGNHQASKDVKMKVSVQHTEAEIIVENGNISGDLSSYKLTELKSLAKARGLKGYSKLKKGELLDLLRAPER